MEEKMTLNFLIIFIYCNYQILHGLKQRFMEMNYAQELQDFVMLFKGLS